MRRLCGWGQTGESLNPKAASLYSHPPHPWVNLCCFDVFVKLCTHEERLEDQGLSSLLYRIATRESLNSIRGRKRRPDAPIEPLLEQIASLDDDEERTVARQLLDRLFGGQIAPLVAHYAQHRALSPEEVARLKALIAEFESDDE